VRFFSFLFIEFFWDEVTTMLHGWIEASIPQLTKNGGLGWNSVIGILFKLG
jgi:hypothetical protein